MRVQPEFVMRVRLLFRWYSIYRMLRLQAEEEGLLVASPFNAKTTRSI